MQVRLSSFLFAILNLTGKKKMKQKRFSKLGKLLPALITGGAGNDPSGIATYVLSGAVFGFTQIWLMLLAIPMLVSVQSLCSRLGIVTKKGLSTLIKNQFGAKTNAVVSVSLIVVNILTLSADAVTVAYMLAKIIGGNPLFWLLGLLTVVWYISVFHSFKILSRFLLLCLVAFLAYIPAAWMSGVSLSDLTSNIIPHFDWFTENYAVSALALLGTTISPYMLFWQVVEENEGRHYAREMDTELKDEDRTVFPGYLFSQIITVLIITVAAATLHKNGIQIKDLLDAAASLEVVAGKYSQLLFGIGVIGAGLLALPVLTGSAAYVAAESLGIKKIGLNRKPHVAKKFYLLYSIFIFSPLLLFFTKVDPLKALYYSQVLAGVITPLVLFFVIMLGRSKSLLGERTSGFFDNAGAIFTFVLMVGATLLSVLI